MPDTDPRERLLQLAGQRGISLSRLSGLIGRNSSYLQQFVRKGSPRKLEETDRRTLARFFGVEESQLGAPEEFSSSREVNTRGGEWVDVPRLAVGASAGPGAIDADERAIGAFRFSARWLREQGEPDYVVGITEPPVAPEAGADDARGQNEEDAYDRAVAIVLRDRKASTSYVQRRLSIGYNRAADLIERMEREGLIGPANNVGRREILVGANGASDAA